MPASKWTRIRRRNQKRWYQYFSDTYHDDQITHDEASYGNTMRGQKRNIAVLPFDWQISGFWLQRRARAP